MNNPRYKFAGVQVADWRVAGSAMSMICLCVSLTTFRIATASPNVEAFTTKGIHVVLQHSENEIVAAIVAFKGGYAYGETENPILAEFMTDLTTSSGSEHFSKDVFREKTSRLVTTISGGGSFYDATFELRCVRPNFDESWELLSDAVLHPLFDPVEHARIAQQRTLEINDRHSSPEGYAYTMGDSAWRATNARFGRMSQTKDVDDATIDAMQKLHATMFQRTRMTLIVVGKISRADLDKKLEAFFSLPEGSDPTALPDEITPPSSSRIVAETRAEIPTSYIVGCMPAPNRGNPDTWVARFTSSYLYDRLFEEVRTKRNLSYAPAAFVTGSMHNFNFVISVSTTQPDSAIAVMLREVDRLRNGDIDTKQFTDMKSVFVTRYYTRQLTNSGQANALYIAVRETGDWHFAYAGEKVYGITPADAQRFAQKYLHHTLFAIVGPTGYTPAKFKFE